MSRYYTPKIEEFHVGFEFYAKFGKEKFFRNFVKPDIFCRPALLKKYISENFYKVKYLDKDDIESLGFDDKHYGGIQPRDTYFKIKADDDVYKITVYWNMLCGERENLVRIYTGKLHNYPYTEIFRGDIKNKSELKRVLKMLNIKDE